MGATVYHALTATTPDDVAYEIRPQAHWNAAHLLTLSLATDEVIKWASAGTASISSGTLVFGNSNGVTFGMNAGTITASVNAGGVAAAAGTQTATSGTIVFANSNGITAGMSGSSQITFSHNGITSQSVQTQSNIQGISAGANSVGTGTVVFSNSNGLSFGLNGQTVTGSYTVPTQTNQSAIKGLGVSNTGATAGNTGLSTGVDWVLAGSQSITLSQSTAVGGPNTIWMQHPAWLTTAALSADSSKYAGLGTTFNGANISGSMTMNTAGLQLSMSVAAPGGGGNTLTMFATSNTTQNSSGTVNVNSIIFAGAGIASVGVTNGSVIISVPSGGGAGDGYNIVSMLTSTSGGGTAGATFSNSAASIGLMAGSNITLSQTSNTINIVAPNSSSLVGASGIGISTAGSTISVYETPVSSFVFPDAQISALAAFGNGSFSIRYQDVLEPVTATRVDMPFLWQQATTANANTIAIAMTVMCGIYTRNASTLNSVSTATTQTTYTYASNSAGNTGITGSAVRPVSIPMNVNLTQGAYYMGFGISTTYSSIGTATSTAAQTISAMGVPGYSSAVGWVGDFSQASATSVGLLSGHGVYSSAIKSAPNAISLSAINQSGSYFHRGHIALIMRGN